MWKYIATPAGITFGPIALSGILFSVLLLLIGLSLIVLPKELAQLSFLQRLLSRKHSLMGNEERGLRAELRIKGGAIIMAWSSALLFSLLIRLIGTPGLETRFLSMLVLFVLPLLLGYILVYRMFFFPRYLKVARSLDVRNTYLPSKKKRLKTKDSSTFPTKALLFAAILPFVYYVVMMEVSIPSTMPVQSHDHLLHQLGMFIIGLLGYPLGLVLSMGDDLRPLLPWVKKN